MVFFLKLDVFVSMLLFHLVHDSYLFNLASTAQDTYLEFLERTNNSLTLRNCDDCVSPAINLGNSPVPFGDLYHAVVHVSWYHK